MTRQIGFSPKLLPALAAIVTGIVLMLIGHDDAGLAVTLTGVGGLGLGAALPPGQTATRHRAEDIGPALKPKPRPKGKPQAGHSVIELAIGVVLFVILIVVLFEVLDRI